MKFGKLEIDGGIIMFALIIVLLGVILHYTVKEEAIKEQTEQLQIQQNIIEKECDKNGNSTN